MWNTVTLLVKRDIQIHFGLIFVSLGYRRRAGASSTISPRPICVFSINILNLLLSVPAWTTYLDNKNNLYITMNCVIGLLEGCEASTILKCFAMSENNGDKELIINVEPGFSHVSNGLMSCHGFMRVASYRLNHLSKDHCKHGTRDRLHLHPDQRFKASFKAVQKTWTKRCSKQTCICLNTEPFCAHWFHMFSSTLWQKSWSPGFQDTTPEEFLRELC